MREGHEQLCISVHETRGYTERYFNGNVYMYQHLRAYAR